MKIFKDKVLLITGGTGSFGNAVLTKFLDSPLKQIRIFSRDEKKQDDMRKKFSNSKISFHIGDVRDRASLDSAFSDVDFIFHAAALKQVPSCEFYPMEAVKTNVIGTENVLDAAIKNKVSKVICLSTDKAVYPINAMGISKALMEKVASAKSRSPEAKDTDICITRYGNVMASRGSVIPLVVDQIKTNQKITITDPNMTRFLMSLEEAVDLVMFAFMNGKNGDIFVQKSPSCTVKTLVTALKEVFNVPNHPVDEIGTRHGEKLFETLLSKEEFSVAEEIDNYFKITPDLRDLNYEKYVNTGDKKISLTNEYNSHNTKILSLVEVVKILKGLPFISANTNKSDFDDKGIF